MCKKRLFKRKKKKEYTIEECEGKKRERVYICKKKKRLCEKRIWEWEYMWEECNRERKNEWKKKKICKKRVYTRKKEKDCISKECEKDSICKKRL